MFETILESEDGVGYTDFRTVWIVHHDVVVFHSVARMRDLSKWGTEWKNKTESEKQQSQNYTDYRKYTQLSGLKSVHVLQINNQHFRKVSHHSLNPQQTNKKTLATMGMVSHLQKQKWYVCVCPSRKLFGVVKTKILHWHKK